VDYDDRGLAALPKLVGGPKYSRPPMTTVSRAERPLDPDDLPLESARTDEDEALARELGLGASSVAFATAGGDGNGHPNGSWSISGSAGDSPTRRRGFGGLFRSRHGRSGAG
jgi:hypothetical protein